VTWVYRDGHMVEKGYAQNLARSDLPCPNVIRDGLPEPLRHMANGRFYDSKRAMEKADKEAGCVCVGNEAPKQVAPEPMPAWKDEIVEAYEKVKQGYKPSHVTQKDVPTESGWI